MWRRHERTQIAGCVRGVWHTSEVTGRTPPSILGLALVSAGLAVALLPVSYLLAVGAVAPLAVILFGKPAFRLAWFVVGALVLLDTTSALSAPKLVYLAGVLLSVGAGLARLPAVLAQPWFARLKPLLWGALSLTLWIVLVTLPYSLLVRGTSLTAWVRDAFTYLLIPAAVIIAVDACGWVGLRVARWGIALVGASAAIQFAITWTARRGLFGESEIYLFGSRAIIAIPVAMGLVYGLAGRGFRPLWFAYSVGALAAVLVTGVRSGLLLLAAYPAAVGSARKMRVPIWKLIPSLFVGGLGALAAILVAAPYLGGIDFLKQRFSSLKKILNSGQIAVDASGRDRANLYAEALRIFNEYPLLGSGLGAVKFVDTPFVYLAKWGALGTAVLAFSLLLILVPCARARPTETYTRETTIAFVAAITWLASLPSAAPTEDKGFALGVALIVLLVGASLREAHRRAAAPPTSHPLAHAGQ